VPRQGRRRAWQKEGWSKSGHSRFLVSQFGLFAVSNIEGEFTLAGVSEDTVRRYLEDAAAAESAFETQLRAFATEGDDEEVKTAFRTHAAETRTQLKLLSARLEELGGETSSIKEAAARVLSLAPPTVQIAHASEERTTMNLIAAYTVEAGECALYEALIEVARAAGDETTVTLARSIQAEAHRTADKLWSFIPSRSIIAFNVLTIGEVDPSIDTKVGEASWTS
jgi:ferritin-like metal-binding protein YciE